jgi:hypothetical protein
MSNNQGTRDIYLDSLLLHIKQSFNLYVNNPVILEDDELNNPEPVFKAIAIIISVDVNVNPASKPSKRPWWNIEDEYYINDNLRLIPPLEQEGLALIPALA